MISGTKRLYFRDYVESDCFTVHEYALLPEFSKYEEWGPNSAQDTKDFISRSIEASKESPRRIYEVAVILQDTLQVIGGARISYELEDVAVGHIGYSINPKYQSNGLGTEVGRALLEFGFLKLDIQLIYATCHVDNKPSYKIMERLGMRRVDRMHKDRIIDGVAYDSYRYEIQINEFKGVKI